MRLQLCGPRTTAILLLAALTLSWVFPRIAIAHSSSPTCRVPFEKTLVSKRIQGGHKIEFSIHELAAFLSSSGITVEDISLHLVLEKKPGSLKDITLAINGIQASHSQGKSILLYKEGQQNIRSECGMRSKLHELFLNGAEPFKKVFGRILKNKGELVIWVAGPSKVRSASIVITGYRRSRDCGPSPEPTPTPTGTPPVAPTVQIDSESPSAALTSSTSQSFAFSSNQAGSNFYCSLDGSQPALCSSPIAYSSLPSGMHSFSVHAVNAAGLSSDPATYAWEIDALPVDVRIDSVTPASPISSSSSMSVAFSSTKTTRAVQFFCSIDQQAQNPCVSPLLLQGLSEGAHSIDITAQDSLGNVSLAPAHYEWSIDQTAPATTIIQVIDADAYSKSVNPSFVFQANESAQFECSLDGAAFEACSSPVEYSALSNGQHRFEVRALDAAGNIGQAAGYSWIIDQIKPVISLGNVVPAEGLTNSASLFVEYSANEPAQFECAYDSAPAAICASPWTQTVQSEGAHELTLQAIDLAGNRSDPVRVSWTTDFSIPQISFGVITPSAAGAINVSSLNVPIVGNEAVTLAYTLDGVMLPDTQSPLELSGLSEGAHILSVQGTDSSGNVSAPIEHSFTVDLSAPMIHFDSIEASGVTQKISNTFSFSSVEAVQFECNLDQGGFAPCSSPYSISGLAEGLHRFEVRASDLAGNVSPTLVHLWSVNFTQPITSLIAVDPSSGTIASSQISIQFAVSEAASSYCSLDGAASVPCSSPYVITGLAEGSHGLRIYSVDSVGNIESPGLSYSFNVDTQAPTVFLSSNAPTLTRLTQAEFNFTADEASIFTCKLDGVALSGCLSPQAYFGLSEGVHVFTVSARDLNGNLGAPASYTWTIDLTPPALAISLEPRSEDSTSAVFSLSANETQATYFCSMDGSAFAACSMTASYSSLLDGSHEFQAYAVDAAGNTSPIQSLTFNVLISADTFLSSIVPAETLTGITSKTFSFSSNLSTATFVCSIDGASPAPCSSPMTYSGLASGSHQFSVQAVSQNGQIDETPATHSWTIDSAAPLIISSSASATKTSITISWVTNEPATSVIRWGQGSTLVNTDGDSVLKTNHVVTITGLSSLTIYSYVITGQDGAGNAYSSPQRAIRTQ